LGSIVHAEWVNFAFSAPGGGQLLGCFFGAGGWAKIPTKHTSTHRNRQAFDGGEILGCMLLKKTVCNKAEFFGDFLRIFVELSLSGFLVFPANEIWEILGVFK
jgi:hypothetical protein